MKNGQYENALISFKDAYIFTRDSRYDPTSFIYNLAELYHLKGEDETALLYLDTLYSYRKQLKPNKILKALQLESKCAIIAGHNGRAFQSIAKYENLADSLYSSTIKNQHSIALVKFRTKQKEEELIESKENQIKLLFLFGISSAILLLVITLINLRLKNQKQRTENEELKKEAAELKNRQLKEELTSQQKEVAVKMMYLVKKNEFIASISKQLKAINNNLSESGKKELFQVIRELENMSEDDTWNEFEMRFKEIHEDFYTKLGQLFPNLTPNELRLCAFLKLNLSTKEISSITFQSPESIKTARYRLRKKMNLDRDANLTSFLHSL
jgi:DNA-binding CsgD family transcriptional regulator